NVAPHAMSAGMEKWIAANPEEAEAFFRTIPLGRVGDCEHDIGRAVAMLASDEAGYLTGATIPLDGGQANFDLRGQGSSIHGKDHLRSVAARRRETYRTQPSYSRRN